MTSKHISMVSSYQVHNINGIFIKTLIKKLWKSTPVLYIRFYSQNTKVLKYKIPILSYILLISEICIQGLQEHWYIYVYAAFKISSNDKQYVNVSVLSMYKN